jgi:ribosomal protein S2
MEKQKIIKIAIPMRMRDRFIRHKVRRTINHLTILTCMAASWDALCPVIVTSHKGPDDIDQGGHRPGKDFLIERNAKPDGDHAIFERFIGHDLTPQITVLMTIPRYSKAEAVLLKDNCSAYVTPEIFRPLGESDIKMVTLAPHIEGKKVVSPLPIFVNIHNK